ncbi:MAG: hemolysin family protein [Intrasporangium sp.]|uniref:hemolysin family protein n=1 Tax=Intrasporangium sp. TaxID=1925024 RepID=UPI002647B911|nr:hemolysin family protein [Intrasporangium sp.]MDN5794300.1 hemolysin family protein [Intrasporangium sp.]
MMAALLISVLLLALNAFFVAAEFALVASRRHRLEDQARGGSRAARAAVAGSHELSLMLAGAQLGITLATLGLGALAKPAVADLLGSALGAVRVPDEVATVVGVIFAVAIVVFLHMVVGEMAPKSWAISHPERSAVLLALPFRAFARLVRPVLALLNGMANLTLRLVGVTPQPELAQAHGPRELQLLIASSREHGTLTEPEHRILAGAIDLETHRLSSLMVPLSEAVTISLGATCTEAEGLSRRSGRSRLLVLDAGAPVGLVHVRDAVRAPEGSLIDRFVSPATVLPPGLTLLEAVEKMRAGRQQLVLVGEPGRPAGLVSMEDLLERVIGRFDDETD